MAKKPIFMSLDHELGQKRFLSVPKVLDYLRQYRSDIAVSKTTLERHIDQGLLVTVWQNNVRVVFLNDLTHYILTRTELNDQRKRKHSRTP